MTGRAGATDQLTLGYLTNVYPAVSHSFIKREILALEALGFTVKRWSIRPCAHQLPDPADRREAELTQVILGEPARMALAVATLLLTRPFRALGALRDSLSVRGRGWRGMIASIAYFAEACLLVRLAREAGVQHVHAHFGTNPAAVVRLVHRLGGPGYSFTAHGPDEFDAPLALDLGRKIADAAFVVGISRYGCSQLMRWCDPSHWNKLHVVRCGVDADYLGTTPAPPCSDEEPLFVSVARLAPQKGLPVLVDAAARMAKAGHRFRVVILGEGDLRPVLEQQIDKAGLADRVSLPGAAGAEHVRATLSQARAFVLPSFAEGLPVSIMEALALERPVITTRIAGIPELVDHECGWLIDAGDAVSLADAMVDALKATPDHLQGLGATGRSRVMALHSVNENAQRLAALFHLSTGGLGRDVA